MKWNETTASKCRYGDIAGRILNGAEIIWEDSEDGDSGFATVLAHLPDSTYMLCSWVYGSCPLSDEWEGRGLSSGEIEREMRIRAAVFDVEGAVLEYLREPILCCGYVSETDSEASDRGDAHAALQKYLNNRTLTI